MALELFQVKNQLYANEIAPRVHNSGHWTIEGSETSQFENHLRAITKMPIGSTKTIGSTLMINLIGGIPKIKPILESGSSNIHLYQKTPKTNRKLGHITYMIDNIEDAHKKLLEVRDLI